MAATDPARAASLIADAERIAWSYTAEGAQGKKVRVLVDLARILAPIDPDHADQLAADAERAAQSIITSTNPSLRLTNRELAQAARALAASHPDHAERIAQSITGESEKADTLGAIAEALAATDPGRAERFARSIADPASRAWALARIARRPSGQHDEVWQPRSLHAARAYLAMLNMRCGCRKPVSPGQMPC